MYVVKSKDCTSILLVIHIYVINSTYGNVSISGPLVYMTSDREFML